MATTPPSLQVQVEGVLFIVLDDNGHNPPSLQMQVEGLLLMFYMTTIPPPLLQTHLEGLLLPF